MKQATDIYTNELRQFQVRDISRLVPGTEILIAHVPDLENPSLEFSKVSAQAHRYTVLEVCEKTANELHHFDTDADWANEKDTVIHVKNKHYEDYMYASDCGVLPYEGGGYNTTNFTVILSDLEDAGMTWINDTSPSYKEALEKYNSQVTDCVDELYYED